MSPGPLQIYITYTLIYLQSLGQEISISEAPCMLSDSYSNHLQRISSRLRLIVRSGSSNRGLKWHVQPQVWGQSIKHED